MSRENVDFVLAAYQWANRERRLGRAGLGRDGWHPDGEYVNSRSDPDHATYRGHDAIEGLFESWFTAYPDLQVVPQEARAKGDRVFVWVRFTGHAAEGNLPLEMELAHVVTLEDGKVRRLEEYMDREEALEAVGLREQT